MYETEPQISDDIPQILTFVAVAVLVGFYRATNNFLLSVLGTALVYLITFIVYGIYKST